MTFCYLCRLNVRICGRIRSGERGERIKVLEALENFGSLENLENLPRGRIGTIEFSPQRLKSEAIRLFLC